MENKIAVQDILAMKGKRKITMLTAYDYPLASLIDRAGIDMILVGDSVANVVLGLDSTTKVGMTEMIHHAKAVTRAVKCALVIGDMPYESYQINPEESVKNAQRFMEEANCDAVKLEWFDRCLEVTEKIIEQALRLEKLGCFSIVLECVPDKIAELITKKLKIPTIGIGAGVHCDGQVLVTHDLLGLFERFTPKFVKKYVNLSSLISQAVEEYKNEVIQAKFPDAEHSFTIKEEELKKLG
jgi:3-methyl-2-oxobutanoate hydroxymethyltransferase